MADPTLLQEQLNEYEEFISDLEAEYTAEADPEVKAALRDELIKAQNKRDSLKKELQAMAGTYSNVPANTNAPFIVTRNPSGSFEQESNPNYMSPTPGIWTDPNTGAQYPIDPKTGGPKKDPYTGVYVDQISPGLSGWIPGVGVQAPLRTSPTEAGNLAQRQKEWDWKIGDEVPYQREWNEKTWQAQQDEAAANRAWRQAQLDENIRGNDITRTTNRANQMQSAFFSSLPYAQIPGQTHFLGFEPGGVWEKVARSRGMAFDPERFRAPVQQFDPLEAWKRAQAS